MRVDNVLFSLMAAVLPCFAGTYTFVAVPGSGNVTGPAGSTVGWGYSISNQSDTDWLVTVGLNAESFAFGFPDSIFDFPDVAPGTTASVSFDPAKGTGLYQFTWNRNAPGGYANFGLFTLSAEWWSGDPLSGGTFKQAAPDSVSSYSATVSAVSTPEPRTSALIVLSIAGLFWRRKSPPACLG